jgi:hypothetical protein
MTHLITHNPGLLICCSARKDPLLPLKYSRVASRGLGRLRMKCPFNGNFEEGHPYSETDAGPVAKAYGADQRRRPGRLPTAIEIHE